MLVKELQSLCLDVRVLDENGNKIELQADEGDDNGENMRDRAYYKSSDDEFAASGFHIEDAESVDTFDDDVDSDDEEIEDGTEFDELFDYEEEVENEVIEEGE